MSDTTDDYYSVFPYVDGSMYFDMGTPGIFDEDDDLWIAGDRFHFDSDTGFNVGCVVITAAETIGISPKDIYFFSSESRVVNSPAFSSPNSHLTSMTLTAFTYHSTISLEETDYKAVDTKKKAYIVLDPPILLAKSFMFMVPTIIDATADALYVGSVQLYAPPCNNADFTCILCVNDPEMYINQYWETHL